MKYKAAELSQDKPIRSLIQHLSLGRYNQARRITAFIAARPNEGTSTIAREYADTLASETKQKVLLIDANPFAPQPFQAYGKDLAEKTIAPTPPNGETMQAAMQDIAIGYSSTHQELLATHPNFNGNNTREIIRSDKLWETLLQSFDSLVIDVPSLQSSFDGIVLAARADAVILVVAAETTPQPVVRHLRNTLVAADAKVAGIVMNKRRYYIPERVYKNL